MPSRQILRCAQDDMPSRQILRCAQDDMYYLQMSNGMFHRFQVDLSREYNYSVR